MRWLESPVDAEAARRLARELKVSPLVARLLVQRGLTEPMAAQAFLHPSLGQLYAPERMAGMREAVARLRRALEQHEKILIYGDYDVDGTMAVVVLLTALRMLGAQVEAYVPHRLTDGYGMRAPVVEEAAANGFRVVISVDTGIREHAVLARARELGVDCIVTDHHLPDGHLPTACAILNPLRPDCGYPEKSLAGVGVAFKLAQALLAERLTARLLQSFLKVVAIGTIADVVPLLGENRVIVRFGLEGLRQPAQSGLAALIELAGLAGKEISAGDVGFRLAPRLNAAGRMENARDVIDLFTLPDAARTREIAERLERLNRERQRVEEEILRAIVAQLERRDDLSKQFTLVLAGEGWHRGVIGIVAQRVVERYHRPALVIGIEEGVGVGSGRSIKSFHLLEALTRVGDLFQRFGGHAQAAGFALTAERIPELTRRFEEHARTVLTAPDLERVLRVDAPVDLAEVDWPLYEEIIQLEPFGMGNPTPVFGACGVRLVATPRILQGKHLKLRVGKGTRTLDALGWGWAARTPPLEAGQQMDLAFTLERNNYQDMASLQLIIKDLVGTGGMGSP
ncbi:MAG TPA: single-stranded-DNA-specific exonuclease RecJ [Terriglobia bacterium]|nr:single-stranded-DNA-specific exonuclease RecJ [Terriglobia bacterium]